MAAGAPVAAKPAGPSEVAKLAGPSKAAKPVDPREAARNALALAAELCGTWDIREKLAALPGRIREAEGRVQALSADLGAAQAELETAEAELMLKILDETAGGKPRYGNEAARRAALTVLKSRDPECRAAAERTRRLALGLELARAERQRLRDEFAAVLTLARLAAAQAELAAAVAKR